MFSSVVAAGLALNRSRPSALRNRARSEVCRLERSIVVIVEYVPGCGEVDGGPGVVVNLDPLPAGFRRCRVVHDFADHETACRAAAGNRAGCAAVGDVIDRGAGDSVVCTLT